MAGDGVCQSRPPRFPVASLPGRRYTSIVFIIALILLGSWVLLAAFIIYAFFLVPQNPPLRPAKLQIGGSTIEAEIADSLLTRTRGLSGRESLLDGAGMLFVFPFPSRSGFWMKSMKFPIDIVWIRKGRVVGLVERVAPQPEASMFKLKIYHPPERADQALEINAGQVKNLALKIGDAVRLL